MEWAIIHLMLNKVPTSYDKTGTIHISEMDDSDWIFTAR